jgi:hypothetical protein
VVKTLQSRRLRRILFAYTVNRLGSWLGLVALSLAVFDHTHSALSVAGLLLAWQALPAFVVPAVVARAEASKRRSELSMLYLFEGIVTAGLAAAVWHFSLPAVLVLAFLDGTGALAANSLLRAEVARVARASLVEPDAVGAASEPQQMLLPQAPASAVADAAETAQAAEQARTDEHAQAAERSANAALNIAFSVSFVSGPVIGGVVSATAGVPAALLIDVATFLLCGALLLDLRAHVEEAGESVAERLRTAWAHVDAAPSLRALLLVDTAAFLFIQAGGPIEVPLVKATLHGGDSSYGLFVTTWGAGAVVASIIFARIPARPLGVILCTAVGALGCAFIGFAVAPSVATACLAAFVGGAGNGLYVPSIISLVQRLTPPDLHGRLMGAVESLGALSVALGLPLGGALAALTSPRTAFATLGAATLAVTAVYVRLVLTSLEPSGRRAPDATATPTRRTRAAGLMPQDPPAE